MDKEKGTGKTLLAAGTAAAACGAMLFAVGQTLNYLFRDVDPKRKKQADEAESDDESID